MHRTFLSCNDATMWAFQKKESCSRATDTSTFHVCMCAPPRTLHDVTRCVSSPLTTDRCCRVEDTDDLVPIFNRQSDMLKRTYGEYFLAEVVAAQTDHMKCIIAEVCWR